MNLCQKTENLTYRATFMRQGRDRVAESPKRSSLGIAYTERWQPFLRGSTTVMLSPIRNMEGTFLMGTTSDTGDKTVSRENTLSKLAHSSSWSSKTSGQDDTQDHPLKWDSPWASLSLQAGEGWHLGATTSTHQTALEGQNILQTEPWMRAIYCHIGRHSNLTLVSTDHFVHLTSCPEPTDS